MRKSVIVEVDLGIADVQIKRCHRTGFIGDVFKLHSHLNDLEACGAERQRISLCGVVDRSFDNYGVRCSGPLNDHRAGICRRDGIFIVVAVTFDVPLRCRVEVIVSVSGMGVSHLRSIIIGKVHIDRRRLPDCIKDYGIARDIAQVGYGFCIGISCRSRTLGR